MPFIAPHPRKIESGIITDNLLGRWDLSEGGGTVLNSTGSDGITGTVNGIQPGTWVSGPPILGGNAINHDGSGTYLSFGDYTPNAVSITFWARFIQVGNGPYIYAGADAYDASQWDWAAYRLSNVLRMQGGPGALSMLINHEMDTWHHFVMVRNDGNGNFIVYKDGIFYNSNPDYSGSGATPGRYLRTGKAGSNYTNFDLGEFRLYADVITEEEANRIATGTG